ncbi:MAG: ABC transporter permease [Spirochaetes bacterium]|nr:ABC transporter permease [Spirochaetota bacterium]
MKLDAALFTALRWGFSARRRMSTNRAILAGAGITAGVTALIVVISVMGGLQKGYIDSILEVSSFHARVDVPREAAETTAEAVRTLPEVATAIAFLETAVVAVSPTGETQPLFLRAMRDDSPSRDPAFTKALGLGSVKRFPVSGGLVLGKEAAAALGAMPGSGVELFGARQTQEEGLLPLSVSLPMVGTFTSGYYEFDASCAYVAIEKGTAAMDLFPMKTATLGIKLKNRWDDVRAKKAIEKILPEGSGAVVSWREYNRSFFGALRTEKSVMLLLISLIFLVVGINIFHAMRRTIASKTQDIAVMKAFGASESAIRALFCLDGLVIGLAGAFAGTCFGLLIASNINLIAGAVASMLRVVADWAGRLGLGGRGGDYRLFSPAYYYLNAIPASITGVEIALIAILAVASTTLSAIVASARVSQAKPSEVLRNE